jgi:Ca2+-binding RTX toxin-like protein
MSHMTNIHTPPIAPILQGAIANGAKEKGISPPTHLGERNEKVRRTILLLAATALAVLLSSGVALALNTINCKTNQVCTGTKRADLMKGTNGFNEIHARGNDDTLKGFGSSDGLFGQVGDDRLRGGRGGDGLFGGKDDDNLRGEEAIDYYIYERSDWGDDTIIEDAPTRNALLFSFGENFTGSVTTNLTSSPLGPEVLNDQSSSTVNWEGNVITFVVGSSGDDTVLGNDAANEIYDYQRFSPTDEDTDTISAGKGNDFIIVEDGDSNDTVNCGEGDDFVFSDEGETLIAADCEENDTTPGGEIFSEAKAAAGENAAGGDLSEFRSFQAPPAQTD